MNKSIIVLGTIVLASALLSPIFPLITLATHNMFWVRVNAVWSLIIFAMTMAALKVATEKEEEND